MNRSIIGKVIGMISILLVLGGIIFAIYKYLSPLVDDDVNEDLDDVFGCSCSQDDKFEE